ncbi:MAG: GNAT family protein [Acidimicrobiales bacterium]
MPELQRVRADHDTAILDFEVANRAYFTRSINDRGDEYFDNFAEEHRALLAEQATGAFAFHVLVDEHGAVIGRFNLFDISDGTANVGYRVAERVAGQGVASAALRQLCQRARDDYGLRTLRASTSDANIGSQRVLEKAGFLASGSTDVAGRNGILYELDLANFDDRF